MSIRTFLKQLFQGKRDGTVADTATIIPAATTPTRPQREPHRKRGGIFMANGHRIRPYGMRILQLSGMIEPEKWLTFRTGR